MIVLTRKLGESVFLRMTPELLRSWAAELEQGGHTHEDLEVVLVGVTPGRKRAQIGIKARGKVQVIRSELAATWQNRKGGTDAK